MTTHAAPSLGWSHTLRRPRIPNTDILLMLHREEDERQQLASTNDQFGMDASVRDRIVSLFALLNEHVAVTVEAHKAGDDGTLFSNWDKSRGSKLTVTLKLDRGKMLYYDTENVGDRPLYFDFSAVNNVAREMAIIPPHEQLEFELALVDERGNRVHADTMGSAKKRPAHLLCTDDGTPLAKVTAQVGRRAVDASPGRLDSVVFRRIMISCGVSSRFLHTESKKFAFRVFASNVDLDRWEACFPNCDLPTALSTGFLVSTSRAPAMERCRSKQKREREETRV